MHIVCGVFLLLLMMSVAHSDIKCDGIDDLLTQAANIDTFINTNVLTITAFINSTGSTFTDNSCWANGPFLMDNLDNLAVGRDGTAATGDACAYSWDVSSKTVHFALQSGWHHIAARLSGGVWELFTDGFTRQTVGFGTIDDLTGILSLCGAPDAKSPDRLSQVAIYDTALTNGDIELMARGRVWDTQRGRPTAYWPLNDCADGISGHNKIFNDRSGNNRHLTGNQGGNGSGLGCMANGHHSHAGWIQ